MYEFTLGQFEWSKEGNGPWRGVAEASQLGLAPGEWPGVLIVQGQRSQALFHDETLPHPDAMARANEEGHQYSDANGHFIHILND